MNIKLERAIRAAENNTYCEVSILKSTTVLSWTLLCLFVINKSRTFLYSAIFGAGYYLSLVVLCLLLFKGIRRYLSFPKENKRLPAFIGQNLDTIFIYPLLLMAIIGIVSNSLIGTGIFHGAKQQINMAAATIESTIISCLLLPLAAFAEELLNLLLVSFFYKYIKLPGNFRFIVSMLLAAMAFGSLHTFGWGAGAAIPIGIAYISVFFATLYTGNIWISFFAHLYNDLIFYAKSYNSSYHLAIITAISIIPAVWAFKSMLRKTS